MALCLAEAEEFANLLHVRMVNDGHVVEVSLLLLCLLRQDVAVVGMLTLDFTRSGKSESLFGTGISLYLWHFLCLFDC